MNRSARFPPSVCVGLAYASDRRHAAGPLRDTGMSDDADLRSPPLHWQPKLARSEFSASTSVHVLPDARITTAGPIARRGLRNEAAHSRRVSGRVPRRRASFRWAEREASADMPVPFEATSELEQA